MLWNQYVTKGTGVPFWTSLNPFGSYLGCPHGFELHYRNFEIPIISWPQNVVFGRPKSEASAKLAAEVLGLRKIGLTYSQIGSQLGISPSRACLLLHETGERDPLNRRWIGHRRKLKCDSAEVMRLRAEGKTFEAIGRELNVSTATARRTFVITQFAQQNNMRQWAASDTQS
jgi:DNA-binding CsgD family transcriptional regulator